MPGKARSADQFYVVGAVKELNELNAEIYHPNGQTWKEHWTACKTTVDLQSGLISRLRKVCGKKCAKVN